MSASFDDSLHTNTHSWDAVLQVALETTGNEREMAEGGEIQRVQACLSSGHTD